MNGKSTHLCGILPQRSTADPSRKTMPVGAFLVMHRMPAFALLLNADRMAYTSAMTSIAKHDSYGMQIETGIRPNGPTAESQRKLEME
ncbi:MAG: hypothetical protein Q9P14_16040 [candidate division KSB1 bacterium]|nr:hypothetical protein [candidate division KSB1 bacterium]MDQ7066392.1 hypothetical protein [candidate division KSB1 bacterium]